MMINIRDYEIADRAKKEGIEQTKIETAKNFLKMELTLEQIAEGTGLPLEKIQELQKELSTK